ncbi:YbaB/EbfC family nucleoid-associated protein [Nonomuraea zeae]|uniref:YbaB/EbfC family DNA-binding protein n=1 Tax=Nonomuraea zeae TaxID=1642303 RepID=A0A5S4GL78_9ACTN|nr:YbaB/EbfC family nucleoid-associated protein [Nonomuraea zeae]TMR27080.1 YbaB/EbfC family DNA-binding protein [Nonomuraea zeae]
MIEREFGALDLDRVLRNADRQMARAVELRTSMAELVGRAQDEDGLVKVEFSSAGLKELILHPKAMRLTSGELSASIKQLVKEAAADLQRQVADMMEEAFGEDNPMRFGTDADGALEQVRQSEAAYNRTVGDLMGELDRIRQRMEG